MVQEYRQHFRGAHRIGGDSEHGNRSHHQILRLTVPSNDLSNFVPRGATHEYAQDAHHSTHCVQLDCR